MARRKVAGLNLETHGTHSPLAVSLGSRVSALRLIAGQTLTCLALRSGVTVSFLSKVETGQTAPSLGSCHKLARALGVTMAELFEGVEG